MRRSIIILLAFVMVGASMPLTALAQETRQECREYYEWFRPYYEGLRWTLGDSAMQPGEALYTHEQHNEMYIYYFENLTTRTQPACWHQYTYTVVAEFFAYAITLDLYHTYESTGIEIPAYVVMSVWVDARQALDTEHTICKYVPDECTDGELNEFEGVIPVPVFDQGSGEENHGA